jgi:hypothetical protein
LTTPFRSLTETATTIGFAFTFFASAIYYAVFCFQFSVSG